jgi:hypothetical protein
MAHTQMAVGAIAAPQFFRYPILYQRFKSQEKSRGMNGTASPVAKKSAREERGK